MSDAAQNVPIPPNVSTSAPVPQTDDQTLEQQMISALSVDDPAQQPSEPAQSQPLSPQPQPQPQNSTGTTTVTADATVAQVLPTAIVDATAQTSLNPSHTISGPHKEVADATVTVEKPNVDNVPGVQYVEQEQYPEFEQLPPEVESFISKVESHEGQLPHEVVVAEKNAPEPTNKYLAQPVIVLPITPKVEKEGAHQKMNFSVRWLVEWSHKIMKMFSGKVVYADQREKA